MLSVAFKSFTSSENESKKVLRFNFKKIQMANVYPKSSCLSGQKFLPSISVLPSLAKVNILGEFNSIL